MTTFKAGTRVRITPEYAKDARSGDGSMEALVGTEGVARNRTHEGSPYVPVLLDGEKTPWLFLSEELEAV